MSKEGVLSVNTSGAPVLETLSSEGGPPTPPNGHNFNFSGSIAGGSAANGAITFITPGGPGAATNGQMDAVVRTDNVTIHINASNDLEVIGGSFVEEFNVDAHTAPGTDPVVPTAGGVVTVTGGQVAAGVVGTNVIRTDSLAANTYTIEIQRSQAVGVSTLADNGVSHFDSADFTVDANGFVSLSGSGAGETITGDTGGALSPTANNWNIITNVAALNAGSTIAFSGAVSTLTYNVSDANANMFFGKASGNPAIGGIGGNVCYGNLSCTAITTGANNTAVGNTALRSLTTGSENTSLGGQSLANFTIGSRNVCIGYNALGIMTSGSDNIVLGRQSGSNYTNLESSNILLSNTGTGAENNTIHIGTQGAGSAQQNRCFIAGIVGVTPSNQQTVVIDSTTGQLGVSSGDVVTWNVVTTNQVGAANNGYIFVSAGGALTISLPATSAVGDEFIVALDGATSWQITQAAGQQIRISSATTTLGATGTLTSTAQGDSVTLVCRTANTLWTAISMIGNLTPA